MGAIRLFFLFFLLVCTSIWPEEVQETGSDIQAPSLSEYMSGVVPRIHDTVSIISGAWVDQGCHAVDKSIVEPYRIGHTYSSNSLDDGTLADGWEFFHPSEIHTCFDGNRTVLTTYESGGAVLRFVSDDSGKPFTPFLQNTGFFISLPLPAQYAFLHFARALKKTIRSTPSQ